MSLASAFLFFLKICAILSLVKKGIKADLRLPGLKTGNGNMAVPPLPRNMESDVKCLFSKRFAIPINKHRESVTKEESSKRSSIKSMSGYLELKGKTMQIKYLLIRAFPNTQRKLIFLSSLNDKSSNFWIQFWRRPTEINQHVDIWTTESHFEKHLSGMFEMFNIDYKVINKDFASAVQQPIINMNNIGNYDQTYHDLKEIYGEMIRLITIYNDILSTSVIGWSTEGRPIHVVHIRRNPIAVKPIIFILCGVHSREWLAVSSCQFVLRKLVFDHKYDKEIGGILQHSDVDIVPMLNPDGYVHSHTKYRRWRKTRSQNKGSRCRGVDLNRNFGYKWGGKGSSRNPCSAIYRGKKPFSENESIALARYLYKVRRKLVAFLDVHTFGQAWMTPWSYTRRFPSHYQKHRSALRKVWSAIKKATGADYLFGRVSSVLYKISGTAVDWVYGSLGVIHTYGIELRPNLKIKSNHFERSAKDIIPSGMDLFVGVKALGLHLTDKEEI